MLATTDKEFLFTGMIDDFNELLYFLFEENFADNPRFVFFSTDEKEYRMHLDDEGVCFYKDNERIPYFYRKGDVFRLETDGEMAIRNKINSLFFKLD